MKHGQPPRRLRPARRRPRPLRLETLEERRLLARFTVIDPGDTTAPFFGDPIDVPTDPATTDDTIASGDFNNDGLPDIAISGITSTNTQTVTILLNTGGGQFGAPATISLPTGLGASIPIAVGDVTGDGNVDIVAGIVQSLGPSVFGLQILTGNGDGTFGTGAFLTTTSRPNSVVLGQFTGSGRLDIVEVDASNIQSFRNLGGGSFATLQAIDNSASNARNLVAADLDGVNGPDIVATGPLLNALNIFLNNGAGLLTFTGFVSLPGSTSSPFRAGVGDFTSDGITDVAVTYQTISGAAFSVFPGNGDGTFGAPTQTTALASGAGTVTVGDYDADGRLDLGIPNQSTNQFLVFPGNGDGTFGASTPFDTGNGPRQAVSVDFNGDGVTDAATVNNFLGESGVTALETIGTLRAAILRANASPGADTIAFNLPPNSVGSISPIALTASLPAIAGPVLIDGYSQPGSAENTLATGTNAVLRVVIQPQTTFGVDTGLTLDSGGSTVQGLVLNGFNLQGIRISGTASGNIFRGNFVGVDAAGAAAAANGQDGILIDTGAAFNTIGGAAVGDRNLISGNTQSGVVIASGATGNVVLGNLIGTDATGTGPVPNGDAGVAVQGAGNTIGGAAAGAGNVLSTNNVGVSLFGGASGNLVLGNIIGLSADQLVSLGNTFAGVDIANAPNNTIGTPAAPNIIAGNSPESTTGGAAMFLSGATTTGNLVEANLIGFNASGASFTNGNGIVVTDGGSAGQGASNNTFRGNVIGSDGGTANYGILLSSDSVAGNLIVGNIIGTNAAATVAFGQDFGVGIFGGASGNTIGGTTAADRNLISGNANSNILIDGSFNNVVIGNYIGTDATGNAALGLFTVDAGVVLDNGAMGNTIGGAGAAANVISGQDGRGVAIQGRSVGTGPNSANNVVLGNRIGLGADGSTIVANDGDGVALTLGATSNTIGGVGAGEGNLISSNTGNGVLIATDATGNVVLGNFIGTDATGTLGRGNQQSGVSLTGPGNTVGGTAPAARNVISANAGDAGVKFGGTTATGNVVSGNFIGTDVSGLLALGNVGWGVLFDVAGPGNTVGGTTTGAGNLISGNQAAGVSLIRQSDGNAILGNRIGTDATGLAALGNTGGIDIADTSNVVVGDGTANGRNVIGGNTAQGGSYGVLIRSPQTTNVVVRGNYIGVGTDGSTPVPNVGDGVQIKGSVAITIGGAAAGQGNVISANQGSGITLVEGTTGDLIQGNLVGTDAAGGSARANTVNGILVQDSPGNTIGGTTPGARNVVSGNTAEGILILGTASTGNLVQGNSLGTDITGTGAVPNTFSGVKLAGGASNNTIGGTATGAGNLISGNASAFGGVFIDGGGATGNQILGNRIGTTADGSAALANQGSGVYIRFDSAGNTVGGSAPGAGNLISGNLNFGIVLVAVSGTVVQGNAIGTDPTGNSAIPNSFDGVRIAFAGSTGTTIGGAGAGEGNQIAGNLGDGVSIIGGASGNLVLGNRIGTNAAGTSALANTNNGVTIDSSPGNTIGGAATGAGNLISGNLSTGIHVVGVDSTGNQFLGNRIGTDTTGSVSIDNGDGIDVAGAVGNTFGGAAAGAGNLISGNRGIGIFFSAGAASNVVLGNRIGTNAAGTAAVPNLVHGVSFAGAGTSSNTIGGTAAGEGNLISGNRDFGVNLSTASSGNILLGNQVGTDASGTVAVPNQLAGIRLGGTTGNTIGGTTAGAGNLVSGNGADGLLIQNGASGNVVLGNVIGLGATGASLGNIGNGVSIQDSPANTIGGIAAGAGNVIAANLQSGILLSGPQTTSTLVQGNTIGTDLADSVNRGNAGDGITILSSPGNTIGGPATGAGNLISGNFEGIRIANLGAGGNLIQGNRIGTNAAGTASIGNSVFAITLETADAGNTIGGANPGEGNLLSGNLLGGIWISRTAGTLVQGNRIGTDPTGTAAVPNATAPIPGEGILLSNAANNNTIGGAAPGAGNLISGNFGKGIWIAGAGVTGNRILGNRIGTNANGDSAIPNTLQGILIETGASGNTIGGIAAGEGNLISGNVLDGVQISGLSTTGNVLLGNSIGTNAAGSAAIANLRNGVGILDSATANTIGGSAPGSGNILSGNAVSGLNINQAPGNLVLGNRIGTNADGTAAVPNGAQGIQISGASANTIGGLAAGEGNLISGNAGDGIQISGSSGNQILGNYVGTDIAGIQAVANLGSGINIGDAPNNTIGGTAAGAGNLISGNGAVFGGSADLANAAGLPPVVVANGPLGTTGLDDLVAGATDPQLGSHALVAYLNQGDGTFGSPIATALAAAPTALAVGKFNGAGFGDVVVATFDPNNPASPGRIQYFAGDGAGGFAAPVDLATGNFRSAGIVTGDFNQDGFLDVAWVGTALDSLPSFVAYRLGNGDGTFLSTVFLPVDQAPSALAFAAIGADSNGAKQSALVATNAGSGTITLYTTSGSGFNGPTTMAVGQAPVAVVIADLDGDGRPDIASANSGDNTVSILTQAAGGTFNPAVAVAAGAHPVSLAVGDYNNNFRADLVVADSDGKNLTILLDGLGGQQRRLPLAGAPTALAPVFLRIPRGFDQADGLAVIDAVPGAPRITVFSANADPGAGLVISGDAATGNLVQGNTIGLNTQTAVLSNLGDGVRIATAPANTIGGAAPGAANTIAGNGRNGVLVLGVVVPGPNPTLHDAPNNVIQGNFIGTTSSTSPPSQGIGNAFEGVFVLYATRTTIGGANPGEGNVISGNGGNGVRIDGDGLNGLGGSNNVVRGNRIGTDPNGVIPVGNGGNGIVLDDAPSNTIGGAAAGEGNLITGNLGDGIDISGVASFSTIAPSQSADGNVIQGNRIGVDANGTVAPGNGGHGIRIEVPVRDTTIGGTVAGAGNVLGGNGLGGILIQNSNASLPATLVSAGTIIQGNFIGVGADGVAPMGNDGPGIDLNSAAGTTIGGADPAARNILANNRGAGIRVGGATTATQILGNFIGVAGDGTTAEGNTLQGIAIVGGAGLVTIGGAATGAGNRIRNNGKAGAEETAAGLSVADSGSVLVLANILGGNAGAGVYVVNGQAVNITQNTIEGNGGAGVRSVSGQSVTILTNVIVGNAGLAIDAGTGGAGPNFPPAPAIGLAPIGGSIVQVMIIGAPDTDYDIQIFLSDLPGFQGSGQGQTFLGEQVVRTDQNGRVIASIPVSTALPEGKFVSATATLLAHGGNTGQFSAAFRTAVPATLTIDNVSTTLGQGGTASLVFTVTLSAPNTIPVLVGFATADGTAIAPADYTSQAGTLTFAPAVSHGGGATTLTITVPIVGNATDPLTKTLFVNLSNPFGALLGNTQGVGTFVVIPTNVSTIILGTDGNDTIIVGPFLTAADGVTPTMILVTLNGVALTPIDLTTPAGRNATINALGGDDTFIIRLGNIAAPGFIAGGPALLQLLGQGGDDTFRFESLPNVPNLIVGLDGGGGSNTLTLGNSGLGADVFAYNEPTPGGALPFPERLEFAPKAGSTSTAFASFSFVNVAQVDPIAIDGDVTLVGDFGRGRAFGTGANLALPPAARIGATPGQPAADNFRINVVGTQAVNVGLQANLSTVPLLPFRGQGGDGVLRATMLGYTANDVFNVRLPESFKNPSVVVSVQGGSPTVAANQTGNLLNLELANPDPANIEVKSTSTPAGLGQLLAFAGVDSIAVYGVVRQQRTQIDQLTFGASLPTVQVNLGATGKVTASVYDPVFVELQADGSRHIALGSQDAGNQADLRLEGSGQTAVVNLARRPAGPIRVLNLAGSGNSILKLVDPDGGARIVSSQVFGRGSGVLMIRYPGRRGVSYMVVYQGLGRIESALKLAPGVRLPRNLVHPARKTKTPAAAHARALATKAPAHRAAAAKAHPHPAAKVPAAVPHGPNFRG